MITLYGIPNCDTVRKARAWLGARGVDYGFHDYKKAGAPPAMLADWTARAGWQALLNRSGTTFRKLPEADTTNLDEARAIALMAAHPSLIRRPIVEIDGVLLIGFDPARYEEAGIGV